MIIEKTIGGKKYSFKFTSLTNRKVCDLKGIEFWEYDNFSVNDYTAWVNYLLRAAIDVESQGKTILSEYEMDDLIEEMAQKDLQDIVNGYLKTVRNLKDKYGIKVEGGEEKKN